MSCLPYFLVLACLLSAPAPARCEAPCVDYNDYLHWAGAAETSFPAYNVAVDGGLAYVGEQYDGIEVLDVSDPASPVLLGGLDTPDRTYAVAAQGFYAFVADRTTGLLVVDCSLGALGHSETRRVVIVR